MIARKAVLQTINALTLCSRDMSKSCAFYSKLGFLQTFGGPDADFTTFSANAPVTSQNNALHINLVRSPSYVPVPQPGLPGGWGRAVIFVDDVDALYTQMLSAGLDAPQPRDAPWGERCMHILDPDGHELSFATPDYDHPRWKPQGASALEESLEELREEQKRTV